MRSASNGLEAPRSRGIGALGFMDGWTDVGEVIKAIAPVFTTGAACFGVYLGFRGLEKWRDETIGKRKTELAEQALVAFYEARDVLGWARSRGFFGEEGSTRTPSAGESDKQQEMRNTYFVPIERLNKKNELFAKIQTTRYAFAAQFGENSLEPFNAILGVRNDIQIASSILIKTTYGDDTDSRFEQRAQPFLDTLGWGTSTAPDDIDRKIEKAVQDIEKTCRPVLTAMRG
jgi:hypothetical protein